MTSLGVAGIISFAVGGTVLLQGYYDWLTSLPVMVGRESVAIFSFLGFLLVGTGLWLIMKDSKTETKQTSA
jgi:hypothetical protein